MKRKIISIDETKCNGCGLCVSACHEGALQMVNGKARLVSDSYCDGLGDCLPECPTGAIQIIERDAAVFDEAAVKVRMEQLKADAKPLPCGCPGTMAQTLERKSVQAVQAEQSVSELTNWPVQIKLLPVRAPYLEGASLLIAADCTAFAFAGIHSEFMKGRVTIIGCPKLDEGDYSEKLTEILQQNDIKSVMVLRMDVPCCGGIVAAAKTALQACGKMIPWSAVVIGRDGSIIERL